MKIVLIMMLLLMLIVLIYFARILCRKHSIFDEQKNDIVESDHRDERNGKKFRLRKLHHWEIVTLGLLIYDAMSIAAAYFLAFWLRYDCRISQIDQNYMKAYLKFIPIYIVICIAIFIAARLYRSIWRFAGYDEMIRVVSVTANYLYYSYSCHHCFLSSYADYLLYIWRNFSVYVYIIDPFLL